MIGINTAQAQEVPLLDRGLFFGNPEISGGSLVLMENGFHLQRVRRNHEYMGKKIDDPFDKARPLTDSKRPLNGYFWSEDGKYILYVKDNNGDENMNILL
ncbi:hypothetical protein EJ377_20820 [Chryseobacterium arthrosphaerae]|uniref:S9 family peptidase n=1 Tax=Chryseobacterium arthrosphaerae TaxID=651561 RepID=A0A3S0N256_9FLAO|nr:hypothetical protein EJ377_20820 [Chryseobacterium arthrosphaerae]